MRCRACAGNLATGVPQNFLRPRTILQILNVKVRRSGRGAAGGQASRVPVVGLVDDGVEELLERLVGLLISGNEADRFDRNVPRVVHLKK